MSRTDGFNWFKFILVRALFAYTVVLGILAVPAGLPETGPEYLLDGTLLSTMSFTFVAHAWTISREESKDVLLGLAMAYALVGLVTMSYGLHLAGY